MEPRLWLRTDFTSIRIELGTARPVGQRLTHWATGAPSSGWPQTPDHYVSKPAFNLNLLSYIPGLFHQTNQQIAKFNLVPKYWDQT